MSESIVVGTDGSASAQQGVDEAVRLAQGPQRSGGDGQPARRRRDHARGRTGSVDALLEVARNVDGYLIVVGSKGMHGARRFALGNVPNAVPHKAPCNVLIVSTE